MSAGCALRKAASPEKIGCEILDFDNKYTLLKH